MIFSKVNHICASLAVVPTALHRAVHSEIEGRILADAIEPDPLPA